MDNMRKLISEHMVRSKATSPHVYSMAEVDVSRIAKWRKLKQSEFLSRHGFKLSFTPFFLEAAVSGIKHFPKINASVEGESVVYKRDINLGCAVALGKDGLDGLIVPVIKNAGGLNLGGIAQSLNDLAARARSKKLKPEDVQGGTFTVTNPGIFGNIFGCPIINQPQLAILALGAIKKRPVVVDDAIAIREMCVLTMSYDHRVIDGALAGQFMRYITEYLENWDLNRSL
jgi:2-oxoglutarate dehydrogenase E2 component (dihydrolipoamide succinyltransferase)